MLLTTRRPYLTRDDSCSNNYHHNTSNVLEAWNLLRWAQGPNDRTASQGLVLWWSSLWCHLGKGVVTPTGVPFYRFFCFHASVITFNVVDNPTNAADACARLQRMNSTACLGRSACYPDRFGQDLCQVLHWLHWQL